MPIKAKSFILTENLVSRFWKYVDKSLGPDSCWEWRGMKNDNGYGCLAASHFEKHLHRGNILAHRIAFAIHYNGVSETCVVMHKCNNPSCVNVKHLKQGKSAENTQDASKDGLLFTVLSDEHKERIVRLFKMGMSCYDIAKELGFNLHGPVKRYVNKCLADGTFTPENCHNKSVRIH